jgi:hypothetical protein
MWGLYSHGIEVKEIPTTFLTKGHDFAGFYNIRPSIGDSSFPIDFIEKFETNKGFFVRQPPA